ncbi:MAG: hypothetical protein WC677_02720 [Clostridia bacterium]|jgi:hypothetical protein
MLEKMDLRPDGLHITRKKDFQPLGEFDERTIEKTLDFAYAMSFGNMGEHRDHRSGGMHTRKNGEIFANTFQGKLSEFALYNELCEDCELEMPDLSTYGLGEWDDCDFIIGGIKVAIKSTKSYGNLLLLESKDWNGSGEYIPNLSKGSSSYDVFVLIRIAPYCEDLLRRNRMLYSQTENKETLESLIYNELWEYDIPGFVTKEELNFAITNNHIIRQGQKLNGKISMDAENYYIQSGDMDSIINLKKIFA